MESCCDLAPAADAKISLRVLCNPDLMRHVTSFLVRPEIEPASHLPSMMTFKCLYDVVAKEGIPIISHKEDFSRPTHLFRWALSMGYAFAPALYILCFCYGHKSAARVECRVFSTLKHVQDGVAHALRRCGGKKEGHSYVDRFPLLKCNPRLYGDGVIFSFTKSLGSKDFIPVDLEVHQVHNFKPDTLGRVARITWDMHSQWISRSNEELVRSISTISSTKSFLPSIGDTGMLESEDNNSCYLLCSVDSCEGRVAKTSFQLFRNKSACFLYKEALISILAGPTSRKEETRLKRVDSIENEEHHFKLDLLSRETHIDIYQVPMLSTANPRDLGEAQVKCVNYFVRHLPG